MEVQFLIDTINAEFYTGVPDSQLKALCNFLMDQYGIDSKHHIIAANEGNATALAAGYYLATKKVPVVYMQNSGEGNIINPVASLLNDKVYAIPVIFIIGWRGEPDEYDEPQHLFQGKVTLQLLEDMDIETFVIEKKTTKEELDFVMDNFRKFLEQGKSVAFVVKKGGLEYNNKIKYKNNNVMTREEIIQHVLTISKEDPIISTTGKASRELFEIREMNHQTHQYDFLTVGSMGHSSSIALGIALHKPETKVWCIDGDGAVLMHMGAMAVIGAAAPSNMVHLIVNNSSHETVGGMPTVADKMDLVMIAKACGYPYAIKVDSLEKLDQELQIIKDKKELCMIEVMCAIGARENLGRPTITTQENKKCFMEYLAKK